MRTDGVCVRVRRASGKYDFCITRALFNGDMMPNAGVGGLERGNGHLKAPSVLSHAARILCIHTIEKKTMSMHTHFIHTHVTW